MDLKVTASVLGFSEVLVVKSGQAAANPALNRLAFGLRADGLSVRKAATGGLSALTESGAEVFHAPAPRMWDSSKSGWSDTTFGLKDHNDTGGSVWVRRRSAGVNWSARCAANATGARSPSRWPRAAWATTTPPARRRGGTWTRSARTTARNRRRCSCGPQRGVCWWKASFQPSCLRT
ncbi:hypothetical protein [Microbispora sp. H10836]|uniref:hypothetical protein n=1 Tax=Microbispora sp. H10836 TaxID=2729106 RepID=UPI00147273C1|nr:hypothetical protein [Microbispora sp. H10836]